MTTQEPKKVDFYKDADTYWNSVDTSIDGMLGGFSELDAPDVKQSLQLLTEINLKDKIRALDCGAGIGRVSKNVLSKVFEKVDLLEQNKKLIIRAKEELGEKEGFEEFFNIGMQEFTPGEKKYDCIWIQWVIGHLTDDDLVSFFERCKKGLKDNGYIVIKDNISKFGYVMDEVDSSFTRSDEIFKTIFKKSDLKLIKEKIQTGFPAGMFQVKMYVLQP
ncbi:hypothetical protein K502DRAFT_306556 [Neoconidiobolus thromboides FSU 785]|nr:hypothetical protein K502DRAFT_306556 [Neoconidiobolus thromboides FSU 785]